MLRIIVVRMCVLMVLQTTAYAQGVSPASEQGTQPIAPVPDTEFLLSREFDRLSKRIEDLENWLNQLKRDQNQIVEYFQTKPPGKDSVSPRQALHDISTNLKAMNEDKYWTLAPENLTRKFLADVSTLERSADRLLGLRTNPAVRQARTLLARRINESRDSRLLELYLSLDRILQTDADTQFFEINVREALNFLSGRDIQNLGQPFEGRRPGVIRTDALKTKVAELIRTFERVPIPTLDVSGGVRQQIDAAFAKIYTNLNNDVANGKKQLDLIARKIEDIKKRGESTFGSTNYMMLLLAFSFGLTVALRAYLRQSVITDQTLVEYGGMSFLILALIILASGDKIKSDTVGPLLGTIAGYIFGRSVSLHAQRVQGEDSGTIVRRNTESVLTEDGQPETAVESKSSKKAESTAEVAIIKDGGARQSPQGIEDVDKARKEPT